MSKLQFCVPMENLVLQCYLSLCFWGSTVEHSLYGSVKIQMRKRGLEAEIGLICILIVWFLIKSTDVPTWLDFFDILSSYEKGWEPHLDHTLDMKFIFSSIRFYFFNRWLLLHQTLWIPFKNFNHRINIKLSLNFISFLNDLSSY